MTAMTCSRVTPAFTVRITITPVVVGEVACAWATDGWTMEVTPIGVRVSARRTLRIAFIALVSRITAVTSVLHDVANVWLDISGAPDLQLRCTTASQERLSAIMSLGHEAELHSQAGRARRRGSVPERRPAPQFPQSGRGPRGDSVGDQPGGTHS